MEQLVYFVRHSMRGTGALTITARRYVNSRAVDKRRPGTPAPSAGSPLWSPAMINHEY